jgi:hypothetical protein
MDKTETVIEYLKKFPETFKEFVDTMSKWFNTTVTEEHLLKLKIESLIRYLVHFVENKGADMLDTMFFADYKKPEYTFLQLQAYSIILIFNKIEKKQPLIFLVF